MRASERADLSKEKAPQTCLQLCHGEQESFSPKNELKGYR